MSPAPTISVTVRAGEPLWRAFGQHRISINLPAPAALPDLLAALAAAYPDFGSRFRGDDLRHRHPYRLFVNHRQIADEEMAGHPLHDGDLVHIVIPVSGGQG